MKKIKLAVLIDDEEIDQRQYTRVMERSGLVEEVLTFTYADQALDHLKANKALEVDLILLDINMPRMNGFEFLTRATDELGAHFAKSVVVMLTTSLNPGDRERAESFPVVKDYINKPLTVEHLQNIVVALNLDKEVSASPHSFAAE